MARDVASAELPRLTRLDGRKLGLALCGPPLIRRHWRRAVARFRTAPLPGMLATYSDGRRFAVDAGDELYEQVYRLGEYEPVVTDVVRRLLQPGDVAVDVGANHGWYALVMAQATGPGGRVHAIEPVPALAAALRRNLELNPQLDVQVHEVAAGERDGLLDLHVFDDLPHGHTSASTLGREKYETQSVPCRRLDQLITDRPALVKVDVEGLEPEVLAGAAGMFEGGRGPMWLIEVNYETAAGFGRRPESVLEHLSRDVYSIFRIEQEAILLDDDVARTPHGATWLCVPDTFLSRVPV